jgi:PAS domain-containing protein
MNLPILLHALAAALAASATGIVALWLLPGRFFLDSTPLFAENALGTLLLFDGETLLDSTPDASALLASSRNPGNSWEKLMAFLSQRFDGIEAAFSNLQHHGEVEIYSRENTHPMLLRAEYRGGITKIELIDSKASPQIATAPLAQRAIIEEVTLLRDAIAAAPMLAWRENAQGEVIWANGPYLLQTCEILTEGKELGWPLPKLFSAPRPQAEIVEARQRLTLPSGKNAWFNISSKAEATGWIRFAVPADAAVQAEASLRDFMQTLSKTFAQLPIGLAIFDASRRLQLFNPALLDLTHLSADFLSMRPSLLSVLDAMRDRKMLPEPKDYRSWRRELVQMEKAAASGAYEETWNLPDGQTYKVVGRPHPNGALALMIQDISTEMQRSRRFREDMELGQAVIDHVENAIAVFDQGGQLLISNAAYATLWGHDPSEWVGECTLRKLSVRWRILSAPSSLWTELEEFVGTVGDRESWQAEARFLDGRLVRCHFAPLSGGSTLTQFRVEKPKEIVRPKLSQPTKRKSA